MRTISLAQIYNVQSVIEPLIHRTTLDHSTTFSHLTGSDIYLKLENLQKTGSFKVRGAASKMFTLMESERKNGVIAASAGNHAQGVAYSSKRIDIPCTIVMPEGASLAKVEATKQYGADVILHGETFDDALHYCQELQKEKGSTFIHPFDDPHIIAGQATIGLEIMEQLADADAIVCPIGGGGLIAGIATAAKQIRSDIRIYGVEAANCPSMGTSLRQHCPTTVATKNTIADGIAVKQPGEMTYEIVERYVDDICTVDEIEITRALFYLLERNKLLVEGSAATVLAAVLHRKLTLDNQKVVLVLSGGNVDINLVSRLIERGLLEEGRYLSIATKVADRPGQLHRLLDILANERANVISVFHHRIGQDVMPGQTEVEIEMETRNPAHIRRIENRLRSEKYEYTRLRV